MNLRIGARITIPGDLRHDHTRLQVAELAWVPPHQRLNVYMVDDAGRELALTPHELALNGARNG